MKKWTRKATISLLEAAGLAHTQMTRGDALVDVWMRWKPSFAMVELVPGCDGEASQALVLIHTETLSAFLQAQGSPPAVDVLALEALATSLGTEAGDLTERGWRAAPSYLLETAQSILLAIGYQICPKCSGDCVLANEDLSPCTECVDGLIVPPVAMRTLSLETVLAEMNAIKLNPEWPEPIAEVVVSCGLELERRLRRLCRPDQEPAGRVTLEDIAARLAAVTNKPVYMGESVMVSAERLQKLEAIESAAELAVKDYPYSTRYGAINALNVALGKGEAASG